MAEVATTTQRAAELVMQILAYAGKGTVKAAAVDLSALVGEMTRLLEVDIPNLVEVRYDLSSDLPAVHVDATRIRQVLMNLITNAAAAIGDQGGTITVTTRVMDCDREFFRQAYVDDDLAAGRYVCFDVADTGCGMSEAIRARIFEPFFTTKTNGRGLGLAATLGMVRSHHGAVRVTSEAGCGTTITVALPAAESPAAAQPPAQPAPRTRQAAGTVLLVDDDNNIRRVAEKLLGRLGFEVLTAADGRAGIEVFRQHSDEIVLVFLDMKMPKMGGEAALPGIRRIRADARVILCSGYGEKIASEMLRGEGPAGFLQKPYGLAQLRKLVDEILPPAHEGP